MHCSPRWQCFLSPYANCESLMYSSDAGCLLSHSLEARFFFASLPVLSLCLVENSNRTVHCFLKAVRANLIFLIFLRC